VLFWLYFGSGGIVKEGENSRLFMFWIEESQREVKILINLFRFSQFPFRAVLKEKMKKESEEC
jgi:hypothetical protein